MPAPVLAPNSNGLLVGKGELYFDRFSSAGVRSGFLHLGNVESVEISTADDKIEKKSSMAASTPILKSITRGRVVSLKATGNDFAQDNVALATGSDTLELTQVATAVTGEILSLGANIVKGRYYKVARFGTISAVVVKVGAGTAVLNTDYTVDLTQGIIRTVLTSSVIIPGANNLTVDYTPTAFVTGTGIQTVRGGNKTLIEGKFMFDGDPTAGPAMLVEVWRTSVAPDGSFNLISEDFGTWQLDATVLDDSAGAYGGSASEPLYRISYS